MASTPHNNDVDPDYLEKANTFWHGFMALSKWALGFVILVLALMALFLL